MRATADARAGFSRLLGDLRERAGVTQRWIAAEMAQRGHDVTAQTVSGWERGAFAPDRPKARALDELLDADGRLLGTLGYSADDLDDADDRLDRLERELAELRQEMADLRAERGAKVYDLLPPQPTTEDYIEEIEAMAAGKVPGRFVTREEADEAIRRLRQRQKDREAEAG